MIYKPQHTKNKMFSIAIIGVTGLVGKKLLQLLEKSKIKDFKLHLFASSKSKGKKIFFRKNVYEIQEVYENSFKGIDLAFFCAGANISKKFVQYAKAANTTVIDSSSAFRCMEDIPLVIPEINSHAITEKSSIISSPNCTTTILLMPIYLLHRKFRIRRIVTSTYQAASGGGVKLINKLLKETKEALENPNKLHHGFFYGFNLFLHETAYNPFHYSEEEAKMIFETRKILEDPKILVSATCVRVPVLRAHSIAANIEFYNDFTLEEVYNIIKTTPKVRIIEDFKNRRFATPMDATGSFDTLCSRIRKDPFQPRTIEMWIVGDQLLKGAALNALQLAEIVIKQKRGLLCS